jgi:hypothetical protein
MTLLDGEMRARFLEDERYLRPPVRGKCSDRPNVRDDIKLDCTPTPMDELLRRCPGFPSSGDPSVDRWEA